MVCTRCSSRLFFLALLLFTNNFLPLLAFANDCAGKKEGDPCNDGNNCTRYDSCVNGVCIGNPIGGIPCDDGNICTKEGICLGGKCIASANPSQDGKDCDDKNNCTIFDKCRNRLCLGISRCIPPAVCTNGECVESPPLACHLCPPGQICCAAGRTRDGKSTCQSSNKCKKCEVGGGCVPCVRIPRCDPNDPDLLVELSSFIATPSKDGILLNWTTEAESDSQVFRIWRAIPDLDNYCGCSENIDSYTQVQVLNREGKPVSIPAKGSKTSGFEYSYLDQEAKPGIAYCYALEDINSKDESKFYFEYIAFTHSGLLEEAK